jgi:hypothetical protein
VWIIHTENPHARVDPGEHDIAQGNPRGRRRIGRMEIDIDDVLVFLRRILGVTDGAVGSPGKPAGMFGEPGMVGRALNGKIERELHSVLISRGDERTKILERSQFRMDGVVAAVGRADGVGAAGIARRRFQRVVAALAVGEADGMNGRQIQHVEAHVPDGGKPLDRIAQCAAALGRIRLRAGKQLVPARETRRLALGLNEIFRAAREGRAVVRAMHRLDCLGREEKRRAPVRRGLLHRSRDFPQSRAQGRSCTQMRRIDEIRAFLQLERGLLAGVALSGKIAGKAAIAIWPCFDGKAITADARKLDRGAPAVVFHRVHI